MRTPALPDLDAHQIVVLAFKDLAEEGDPAACARLLAYFSAFGLSMLVVAAQWPWRAALRRPGYLLAWAFSLSALAATWRLILRFVVEYAAVKESVGQESMPNLLSQAYLDVSDNLGGWFWSSQLLLWVIPGCVHLHSEGIAKEIGRWTVLAYALLGFLGAIALSFPLFFAHVLLLPRTYRRSGKAPSGLVPCSLAGLVSVVVMPVAARTGHRLPFDVALGTLHVVLAVPAVLAVKQLGEDRRRAELLSLYSLLAGASACLHVHNVAAVVAEGGGFGAAAAALTGCSCQLSIGIDAILMTVVSVLWMVLDGGVAALPFCAAVPLVSAAGSLSAYLAAKERSCKGPKME